LRFDLRFRAASHVLPFPRADSLRSRADNFHPTVQHGIFTEHKRATLAPEVDGGRWLTAARRGIGLGITPDMQGACFVSSTSAGFSGRRWKSKSGFKLVATDLDGTFMADTPNPPWVQASVQTCNPGSISWLYASRPQCYVHGLL
jgi:hypothetical protein